MGWGIMKNNKPNALLGPVEQSLARRRRSKKLIERTVNKKEFSGEPEDGWHFSDKKYKNIIKLEKPKPNDEVFEDEVWCLFQSMGFTTMSAGRNFVIKYGKGDADTQQIDVLAADDDAAIVVECKATKEAGKIEKGVFKKNIEAMISQRQGIINQLKKTLGNPKLKVAFIFATKDYRLIDNDVDRLKSGRIHHFGDNEIEYYRELASHLGSAARYQLEADLFPNQKIPNIANEVYAIESRVGKMKCYTFSIEPERLLKLGYVLHRSRAVDAMPNYQRLIKKSRLKNIREFVETGGYFPNSLIVNINDSVIFDPLGKSIKDSASNIGVLKLPQKYKSVFIIDGQHRLYSYSDSPKAKSSTVPVVAFVKLDGEEQLKMFMDINENQKAISANMRTTLEADLKWESKDLKERSIGLINTIAINLGEDSNSPLFGRVMVGEDKRSELRRISLTSIARGIKGTKIVGRFSSSEVITPGYFYTGSSENTLKKINIVLWKYLDQISESAPEEWNRAQNEGGLISSPNGATALIYILGDILEFVIETKKKTDSTTTPEEIYEYCSTHVAILSEYLNNVPSEDRSEMRRQKGGQAPQIFRRFYQRALNAVESDFLPEGYTEFWESRENEIVDTAKRQIASIEKALKQNTQLLLEQKFNDNWEIAGIPTKVRKSANDLRIEKEGQSGKAVNFMDCLNLINYRDIFLQNWEDVFKPIYIFPKSEKKAKKTQSQWLEKLNKIRNDLSHQHMILPEDAEYLSGIHDWVLEGNTEPLEAGGHLTG